MKTKKGKMTQKDKENLEMLSRYEWPGKRAYNRLLKAAREGYLEIDENNPSMKKLDEGTKSLGVFKVKKFKYR